MNSILGVEATASALRAVRLTGWRSVPAESAEVAWNHANPGEGVSALLEKMGGTKTPRVVLSIDLSLLFVKRLKLPPVSAAEKRRIVSLEPDRFFPVRGGDELTVVTRDADGLAFAVSEPTLAGWLAELETLGPVDYVEPSPMSLARALAKLGISDATVLLDRKNAGTVIVQIGDAIVRDARRLSGTLIDAIGQLAQQATDAAAQRTIYIDPWDKARAEEIKRAQPSLDVHHLPTVDGVDSGSLLAYGAALAAGSPAEAGLIPDSSLRKLRARRRQPRFVAMAACMAALMFAIWSADYSRTRTESRLDEQLRALSDRASSTLALETETRRLAQEEQVLARAQRERPQQLATLLAVSVRLPADAHIQVLRAAGREWQLDGVAANAARLIPALEAHESIEGVRFLEATRRADRRGEVRENFSLALRAVRAP